MKKKKIEVDIDKRWEEGMDHHPESIRLMKELQAVDKLNGYVAEDLLETGGDGDSGETLMFLMDVVFELRDAAK